MLFRSPCVSLIHMNGRVYDPALGRFMSSDPNVARPGSTQGFNRYAYVENMPLSATDPSGFVMQEESTDLGTITVTGHRIMGDPNTSYFYNMDWANFLFHQRDMGHNQVGIRLPGGQVMVFSDLKEYGVDPYVTQAIDNAIGENLSILQVQSQAAADGYFRTLLGGPNRGRNGLRDITGDPNHPQYRTANGTTIRLNKAPPKTVLPSGDTLDALIKFADATGLDSVLITGGDEQSGHTEHSFHYKNLAIDVAGPAFNNLTTEQVFQAARAAGFTAGQYEDYDGTSRDHWHLQIGVGNGVPAL